MSRRRVIFLAVFCMTALLAFIFFIGFWPSEKCPGEAPFELRVLSEFQNKAIKESSGLCPDGNGAFYTMNDDSDNCLYRTDLSGQNLGELCLKAENQDWEELCRAPDGRIFVGDFGNNFNRRTDLNILMMRPGMENAPEKINFRYQDQNSFPPLNPFSWNFDCEAMVFAHDSLWLFTKNKTGKSTNLYVLPAKKGEQLARKIAEIPLEGTVTAAALRPDGKELALLVYRKIYFFSLRHGLRQISSPDICLSAPQIRQSEAVCYISRDSLLMSNEQGQLFLFTRK